MSQPEFSVPSTMDAAAVTAASVHGRITSVRPFRYCFIWQLSYVLIPIFSLLISCQATWKASWNAASVEPHRCRHCHIGLDCIAQP